MFVKEISFKYYRVDQSLQLKTDEILQIYLSHSQWLHSTQLIMGRGSPEAVTNLIEEHVGEAL